MDQIAFHEAEMKRHFEAGRMASARWHCRIWTRLVAGCKFFNGGTEASGQRIPSRAGTPSPYQAKDARCDTREGEHDGR